MKVNLNDHSYHIVFDKLNQIGQYITKPKGTKILIISNPRIHNLYGNKIKKPLIAKGYQIFSKNIPAGEKSKTLQTADQLYTFLIKNNFSRKDLIIALGGGVVGDLSGFVAATFLRGIEYIQLPTTLLAQVDSSVGGKTAVNHKLGKNLIGSFYQPSLVLIDKSTLNTLPKRERFAGMAEVIKYGIIKDKRFFSKLEQDITITNTMIAKCCFIKSKVVEKDEKESSLRIILNFGHTIGHALEAHTIYKEYLHGEAVALGMIAAGYISKELSLITDKEFLRIINLIKKAGLPTKIKHAYDFRKLKTIMLKDKKTSGGLINFVLINSIGGTTIRNDVPWKLIKESVLYLENG